MGGEEKDSDTEINKITTQDEPPAEQAIDKPTEADISSDVKCPYCKDVYADPAVLPCKHVLCRIKCAGKIIRYKRYLKCPVCGVDHNLPDGELGLPMDMAIGKKVSELRGEEFVPSLPKKRDPSELPDCPFRDEDIEGKLPPGPQGPRLPLGPRVRPPRGTPGPPRQRFTGPGGPRNGLPPGGSGPRFRHPGPIGPTGPGPRHVMMHGHLRGPPGPQGGQRPWMRPCPRGPRPRLPPDHADYDKYLEQECLEEEFLEEEYLPEEYSQAEFFQEATAGSEDEEEPLPPIDIGTDKPFPLMALPLGPGEKKKGPPAVRSAPDYGPGGPPVHGRGGPRGRGVPRGRGPAGPHGPRGGGPMNGPPPEFYDEELDYEGYSEEEYTEPNFGPRGPGPRSTWRGGPPQNGPGGGPPFGPRSFPWGPRGPPPRGPPDGPRWMGPGGSRGPPPPWHMDGSGPRGPPPHGPRGPNGPRGPPPFGPRGPGPRGPPPGGPQFGAGESYNQWPPPNMPPPNMPPPNMPPPNMPPPNMPPQIGPPTNYAENGQTPDSGVPPQPMYPPQTMDYSYMSAQMYYQQYANYAAMYAAAYPWMYDPAYTGAYPQTTAVTTTASQDTTTVTASTYQATSAATTLPGTITLSKGPELYNTVPTGVPEVPATTVTTSVNAAATATLPDKPAAPALAFLNWSKTYEAKDNAEMPEVEVAQKPRQKITLNLSSKRGKNTKTEEVEKTPESVPSQFYNPFQTISQTPVVPAPAGTTSNNNLFFFSTDHIPITITANTKKKKQSVDDFELIIPQTVPLPPQDPPPLPSAPPPEQSPPPPPPEDVPPLPPGGFIPVGKRVKNINAPIIVESTPSAKPVKSILKRRPTEGAEPAPEAPVKKTKPESEGKASRFLWIGGLPANTKAADFNSFLNYFVQVKNCKIGTNKGVKGSAVFALVTLETVVEGAKLVQVLADEPFRGTLLSVKKLKSDPTAKSKAPASS